MTAIAVTATQVGPVFPEKAEMFDIKAAVALTAGDLVYRNTAGKAAKADANAGSGAEACIGMALKTVGAGDTVTILKKGHVYGFTISGLAYGAAAYLSDTAGGMDTAPSATHPIRVGTVVNLTDSSLTKVLWFEVDWVNPGDAAQDAGGIFVSTEVTATGSAQNVAHGLGVVPRYVLISMTEHPGTPDTGAMDIAEGTHTSTNIVFTATANIKVKILAIP